MTGSQNRARVAVSRACGFATIVLLVSIGARNASSQLQTVAPPSSVTASGSSPSGGVRAGWRRVYIVVRLDAPAFQDAFVVAQAQRALRSDAVIVRPDSISARVIARAVLDLVSLAAALSDSTASERIVRKSVGSGGRVIHRALLASATTILREPRGTQPEFVAGVGRARVVAVGLPTALR
ncbi:MAG: hypothetical protein HYX65_07140 [Gemmatimonadetes bacterium]|nr:hypothetical protein [Gemmatimonadota bacterium]